MMVSAFDAILLSSEPNCMYASAATRLAAPAGEAVRVSDLVGATECGYSMALDVAGPTPMGSPVNGLVDVPPRLEVGRVTLVRFQLEAIATKTSVGISSRQLYGNGYAMKGYSQVLSPGNLAANSAMLAQGWANPVRATSATVDWYMEPSLVEATGREPEATGRDADATGGEAEATGRDAEATGRDAEATGRDAEATGRDADATGREAELTIYSVTDGEPASSSLCIRFPSVESMQAIRMYLSVHDVSQDLRGSGSVSLFKPVPTPASRPYYQPSMDRTTVFGKWKFAPPDAFHPAVLTVSQDSLTVHAENTMSMAVTFSTNTVHAASSPRVRHTLMMPSPQGRQLEADIIQWLRTVVPASQWHLANNQLTFAGHSLLPDVPPTVHVPANKNVFHRQPAPGQPLRA